MTDSGEILNEMEMDITTDNFVNMELCDAEEEEEEDGEDEIFDTTAPLGEEERDRANEDSSAEVWRDRKQDNFDDFQFERENQEYGPANTAQDVEARLAGLWADEGQILTANIDKSRRFVCIDYPCVVQNLDRALATLEGPKAISKVLSESGRLPLYFRPDDSYCKPLFAECILSQNLLVKVRRRKKKKSRELEKNKEQSSDANTTDCESTQIPDQDSYEYQLQVEGVVDRVFSFDGMCDFQYLPVIKVENPGASQSISTKESHCGPYKEILSQLVPGFEDDRDEYMARNLPLYLPPLLFSRRQLPVSFQFEDDLLSTKRLDVIETERKKRFIGSIHVTFDHLGIPMEPHPDTQFCLEKLPKHQREAGVNAMKKFFEERPLWTKAGIEVNIEPIWRQYIKYLLPMVAYYFTNGAWKGLWCKFGYDPRKIPESKLYQTIDFRIRKSLHRSKFDGKREQFTKGAFRFNTHNPRVTTGIVASSDVQYMSNINATYAAKHMGKAVKELQYVFRLGMMPPFRQMRYQACDIHHPEVQAKLHENDGKETECTERDGWCVPDFTDICRDILYKEVVKLQAAQGQ